MTRQYSDQGYHAEVRAREASAAPAALFKRAFPESFLKAENFTTGPIADRIGKSKSAVHKIVAGLQRVSPAVSEAVLSA
jgi:hypothetical protein